MRGGGREGPRWRMNNQMLLQFFCAPPLQTLVEPRFNFCLHFPFSSNFFVFPRPPARGGRTYLARPPAHPTPTVFGCVWRGCPTPLGALVARSGRIKHDHRLTWRQPNVLSGRLFSPPGS